jgi:hypothetical protein
MSGRPAIKRLLRTDSGSHSQPRKSTLHIVRFFRPAKDESHVGDLEQILDRNRQIAIWGICALNG